MARFVPQRWNADLTGIGPRRTRAGGTFRAYIPDLLADLDPRVAGAVLADLADAEQAMLRLELRGGSTSDHRLEVLARMLLRAEAVGSSQIEGLTVSPRKLALADLDLKLASAGHALEVVGNLRALSDALERSVKPGLFTIDDLCAIHRRLLEGTRDEALGGRIRSEQNWIGGGSPLHAEFVPPPPTEVPALLADLCAYISDDRHPPLMQAAIAHAQFETIHPFADGNGRTGRALLQLVLRRRRLCATVTPPISLVLATRSKAYIAALMALRHDADADSATAHEAWNGWFELVAHATRLACAKALEYDHHMEALTQEWRHMVTQHFGLVRADAALWSVLNKLPGAPLITVQTAMALTGRSQKAIEVALNDLAAAGILRQVGGRLRYRVFEAVGVFDRMTLVERALASPVGDTQVEPPQRPVPALPPRR